MGIGLATLAKVCNIIDVDIARILIHSNGNDPLNILKLTIVTIKPNLQGQLVSEVSEVSVIFEYL